MGKLSRVPASPFKAARVFYPTPQKTTGVSKRRYTLRVPDKAILQYYENVADRILPFLRGRRVGVRHTFDHSPVFRRHPTTLLRKLRGASPTSLKGWPEPRWIYVPNKRVLLEIVRQHGYEFFPHLEGNRDCWFALDIDVRAVPLSLGKTVVKTALDILDERGVQYLLTFSGSNGFHVHWSFPLRGFPGRKWQFLRRIVRSLQQETERRLQASALRSAFTAHIPRGDPITERNAMDREAQTSVLFDELILKRQATIRAPFSLHLKRRWAAVPIEPRRLDAFVPATDATMAAALAQGKWSRLPVNLVALFQKRPWIS